MRSRRLRYAGVLFVLLVAFFVTACRLEPTRRGRAGAHAVFDSVVGQVRAHFYDRSLRGLDLGAIAHDYRSELRLDMSDADLQAVVNRFLARLSASHTHLYSVNDPTFWALESIFTHLIDGAPVYQVGMWTEMIEGRHFVRNVFEGSLADQIGLRRGDEIVDVDGRAFEPVRSFADGKVIQLTVRRRPEEPVMRIRMKPVRESWQRTHLRATRASARVVSHRGARVAYLRLWSGTHGEFRRELAAAATRCERTADAMVLDLRDGFGGAYPDFVDPFFDGRNNRPLIVLINDGTRSGKEWITEILRRRDRATLVGTRTKGAFLAGRWVRIVPGRFKLLVAAAEGPRDIEIEGRGVAPHVEVTSPLRYSAGRDPQLRRALDEAAWQAVGTPPRREF